MHTLLTRSVVPSSQSGHQITNKGLLALFSMRHPAEPMLGAKQGGHYAYGGIITRIAPFGAGPSTSGVPFVRIDLLETHVVGVTSRLDWHIGLLKRIARRQGLLPEDECGPTTQ
ncbi:unnamed protein product [Linum trigynum]|uniref:Uncharacterized protein n=1 Tax=Linum trigynum TaxID=586398 RepID=A0AAV2GNM6_9ROSI